jgi:hypothetical protein
MRRFFAGLALGVAGSLSVSLGLIATIVIFVVVVALGISIRSFAAIAGALIGWGSAWAAFLYLSFGRSLCNGPGCDQGQTALPFLAVALAILASGLLVGLIGAALSVMRDRAARST